MVKGWLSVMENVGRGTTSSVLVLKRNAFVGIALYFVVYVPLFHLVVHMCTCQV